MNELPYKTVKPHKRYKEFHLPQAAYGHCWGYWLRTAIEFQLEQRFYIKTAQHISLQELSGDYF